MKAGQHLELEEDNSTNSTPQIGGNTNRFPNYPHHPSFLSTPPHLVPLRQYPPLPHSEIPQITPVKPTPPSPKRPRITPTTSSEDGCTIESSRRPSGRPRPTGRPRGSKNKPKPPIIINQATQPALAPYIIELPSGLDLVDSLTRLTQRRGAGLCVLSATGTVDNVTLKQPSTSVPGGTVMLRGKFDILSLSACLLSTNAGNTTPFNAFCGVFTITLSGPQGQIVGGKVAGPLVCAGTVYVVATSFSNPAYTRLPLEVDGAVAQTGQSSSPDSDGNGDGDGGTDTGAYSGHHKRSSSSSEVLWAPTPLAARPPQPPH